MLIGSVEDETETGMEILVDEPPVEEDDNSIIS